MSIETRTCAKCSAAISLDADDLAFLESLKVPVPRFCHNCLLAQRLAFRNERTIYKHKCDVPGHTEEIISAYAPDTGTIVYDTPSWWGDSWDAMASGHDYDFSRPFFAQLKELSRKLPWPALFNWNGVSSEYCNYTTDNKNCYLVFGGDFNENCSYSTFNFHSKDTIETYFVEKCELCYELVDSEACYRVRFGRYAESCTDSMFLYDCVGCTNCIGCVGLRSKSYHIFNQQYSKEEYQKEVTRLALNTREGLAAARKHFEELRLTLPHRYAHIFKSANVSGDNILNSKNVHDSFDISGPAENLKYFFLGGWNLKDSRYSNHAGHGTELMHNSSSTFSGCNRILFSTIISSSQNTVYSWNCRGCSNIFGCVDLRNKKYCILNKQYSKEEYEALVPKIIEHMNAMPYKGTNGQEYIYGDFLPPDLSFFGYNETIANEYFPLSREQAAAQGFSWHDAEERNNVATIDAAAVPNSIGEVADSILKETIGCAHAGSCAHRCTKAFRIIASELAFYRRLDLPLPQLCPNCRHYERLAQRNPLQLWHRACACAKAGHFHETGACPNEFETSYAPDRPEIVYCEQCYQAEVV